MLNMKYILLLNVKVITIVCILIFINRINATLYCFKAGKKSICIFQYNFSFYELKFHAHMSFITSGLGSTVFVAWRELLVACGELSIIYFLSNFRCLVALKKLNTEMRVCNLVWICLYFLKSAAPLFIAENVDSLNCI